MNVLLSIKPKYVEAIKNGKKKYEFRKIIFKARNLERIYIYASSPIKKIVGSFSVGDVIEGSPEMLWDQFSRDAGIGEQDFFSYFLDREIGYAIEIKNFHTMEEPVEPSEVFNRFTPPQSFIYIRDELEEINVN